MYHKAVLSVCYTPRSSSPGSSSSLPCGKDGWFSLLSCTTIYVYVILSKNASLSRSRGLSLVCGCKGTHFPRHGQNKKHFFLQKKTLFSNNRITPSRARNILWYIKNKGEEMPACMKRRQILLTSFFFCNFALEFQLSNKKHEATIDFGSQRVA